VLLVKRRTVHILATVRQPELLEAALLVFKSLRVGFPTFKVACYPNVLIDSPEAELAIQKAALDTDCEVRFQTNNGEPYVWDHPGWIRHIIETEKGTAIICDTDMILYENMEGWELGGVHMMGWRIPQFRCPYTRSVTLQRLHTCLLWLDCDALRSLLEWESKKYMAPMDLISPCTFWDCGTKYFHDTLGQMANACYVNTRGFTDQQLDALGHCFSGTLLDVVGPTVPGLAEAHAAAYADPNALRGAWRHQMEFFNSRSANQ
jgi:hypothetical protein